MGLAALPGRQRPGRRRLHAGRARNRRARGLGMRSREGAAEAVNTGVLGVREPSTCGRSHPHELEETHSRRRVRPGTRRGGGTADRRFCSIAPTRIIPKTGRPSSTASSARSGTPEGSACTRATSICSRTCSKLQRVRAHRRRGRRCRTARRSRLDASRAPGAAPLHQSRPARCRAVAGRPADGRSGRGDLGDLRAPIRPSAHRHETRHGEEGGNAVGRALPAGDDVRARMRAGGVPAPASKGPPDAGLSREDGACGPISRACQ